MAGDGSVRGLLESGARGGIERFVVFSAAQTPHQVESINTYIAHVISSQNGELPALVGFGTLHPDFPDPGAEIDRMISLGLRGVKFHPDMQRFCIDDPRMMKIYALLAGRLPVVFHTGDYRYEYSEPRRLARVLDAFPRLEAVAAHFGGWSVFDLALESFKTRKCFFDVSSAIPYIGKERAAELIHIYGADRFLFGSDYPMWDPADSLKEFMTLPISDHEKETILSTNADRLLQ
jgi:predicted TIM-barrel fold metal-dependent hydrolase